MYIGFLTIVFENIFKIITEVNLNSTGGTNDCQKSTCTRTHTDINKSSTGPHWGPSVPSFGDKLSVQVAG